MFPVILIKTAVGCITEILVTSAGRDEKSNLKQPVKALLHFLNYKSKQTQTYCSCSGGHIGLFGSKEEVNKIRSALRLT